MKQTNRPPRRVLPWVIVCLALAAPATAARDSTYGDEQLIAAPLPGGGTIKALLMVPEKPVALAVAFTGRGGALELSGSNAMVVMGHEQYSFLLRARNAFFKRDVALLAVDAPDGKPMGPAEREDSAAAVAALLKHLSTVCRACTGVPAWAVGWDSGTISAVALAIRQPHVIEGLVLASAITQAVGLSSDWAKRHPQGVAAMAVDTWAKPVLVVADRDDRCAQSPPDDAAMLAARFTRSPRREVKLAAGGNPNGDACDKRSPHGFFDIEDDTVAAIVGFIVGSR
jgi:pimeloyl-ACP methyl ester carboxylesterase